MGVFFLFLGVMLEPVYIVFSAMPCSVLTPLVKMHFSQVIARFLFEFN